MKPFYLLMVALCLHLCAWCQGAPQDEHETKIETVLANKADDDFRFYRGGGSYSDFKYFLRNDTLWFAGTNLYTTVIPLANINFERQLYFLESSLYKTKAGNKCIEVALYATKGKFFEKEFEIEAFKALDDDPTTDFANLVLPDKAFAEAFMKYLKERRD